MNDATSKPGRVLILGADGFIGRHIAFHLRAQGWDVLALARRPERLAEMGFETLKVDLTEPGAADPGFWRLLLSRVSHVVNAAGLLSASSEAGHAVHVAAPAAIALALPAGTPGVLISAVGIENGQTEFARWRLAGEDVARDAGHTILRAGLVLADTSYGGSSLARALAALPFAMPIVGDGSQEFNPIHADDLAAQVNHCLEHPQPGATLETGGPETVTQSGMLGAMRRWLGLKPARTFELPLATANVLGRIGDFMRLGPISQTSVAQLQSGILANPSPDLPQARGFSEFQMARPAGTQDLWHARLYLMGPGLRLVLAFMWLVSGMIGLFLPAPNFLPLLPSFLPDAFAIGLARFMGVVDLAIAAALLRGWRPRVMAGVQAAIVAGYTFGLTLLAPALWLLPLGGLLKNLPLLGLIALPAILEDQR